MGADLERLAFAIFASDFHSPEDLEEAPRIWREMKAVEPYEAAALTFTASLSDASPSSGDE